MSFTPEVNVLSFLDELTLLCLDIGTPKIVNFPFGTNGKLMVLGVPILKHFRVCYDGEVSFFQFYQN